MCTVDLTAQRAMWRFWIVLVLVACLSWRVTPRPTVVTDDDTDGSGEELTDGDWSFFTDDVWYGSFGRRRLK